MKTSLATALANKDAASTISLSSSYQVPATDGRMVLATPLKFCLNYRPPTIAVVYTLEKSKKTTKSGKQRKYIHEIRVDFESCIDRNKHKASSLHTNAEKPTKNELELLCNKLCEKEATYLNVNVISKTQVLNLLNKLFENKYGCKPVASPKAVATKVVESGAAPGAPQNLFSSKPPEKDDDKISDDYDDDFDDLEDKKKDQKKIQDASQKGKNKVQETEDDWDLDNDWGDLDDKKGKNKNSVGLAKPAKDNKKELAAQKRQNLFFGAKDDDDDLDDLPEIGSNFPHSNEDKFNQVMSSSKEGGGLLASIGLRKDDVRDESIGEDSQEEDPHKKSNLFDTSKDKIGGHNAKKDMQQSDEEDFDLGFGSSKKAAALKGINKSGAGEFENEMGMMYEEDDAEENSKAINEQFKMIYEADPELRKALEKSDVASFSVEEKLQIIEAYMQGGAAGLQIELEDEEEEELDEKVLMEMSEEEVQAIETQFAKLYAQEPELQGAIGHISSLSLLQKYQILVQYQRAGETSGMANSNDPYFSGDEMTEIIERDGIKFRRVQIEGQDGDHLMDEEGNIYTLDFEKIGKAGESDEDDEI